MYIYVVVGSLTLSHMFLMWGRVKGCSNNQLFSRFLCTTVRCIQWISEFWTGLVFGHLGCVRSLDVRTWPFEPISKSYFAGPNVIGISIATYKPNAITFGLKAQICVWIQWNAEIRTTDNQTTPKSERSIVRTSLVRILDIRAWALSFRFRTR